MGNFRWLKPVIAWSLWALLMAGLQTTMWPMFLGSVPAPQLWLNVALYFILFQPMMRALFIVYALGLLFAPFTSLHLSIFWATFLVLVPVGSYIKSRTFWPGVRYFLIASLLIGLGWHFVSFAISQIFERNPTDLHLFTRLTEVLLTPLAAVPQYHFMLRLDRWCQAEPAPQFGGSAE